MGKTSDQNSLLYGVVGLALLALAFQFSQSLAVSQELSRSPNNALSSQEVVIKTGDGETVINMEQLLKELLPEKKVLPVTWQGIPFKLIETGIIDIEKLKDYSVRYDQTVSESDLKIFQKDYNGNIEITPNNSVFVYNVLWAIGFAAQSPVLDYELEQYGWETITNLAGYYFSFANLGNKSNLPQSGYNYFDFVSLNQEQKELVMKIAGQSAVPSCGNSLLLPDCSCSYAMDALILLAASQNFSEDQIYQAMKNMYPYRYPGLYVRHALWFQLAQKQQWSDVDAKELVSVQFSSAQGVAQVSRALANILNLNQTEIKEDHKEDH